MTGERTRDSAEFEEQVAPCAAGWRELTATPATAFPGNGRMRTDLAEIAALEKDVARLRLDPPLGSRDPICCRGLPWGTCHRRYHPIHEPHGRLLGQCTHGEPLPHPENRAGPSSSLCHQGRGETCSRTSRASTIPAACIRPSATSAQPRWGAERLNPINSFGGRSRKCSRPAPLGSEIMMRI